MRMFAASRGEWCRDRADVLDNGGTPTVNSSLTASIGPLRTHSGHNSTRDVRPLYNYLILWWVQQDSNLRPAD